MSDRALFTVPDGQFDALLIEPAKLPAPGLLVIPEVFGRSKQLREMSSVFARAGFLVGMLDIHWRQEPGFGLEPHEVERARAMHLKLDYELAIADIAAAVDQFRAHPGCDGRVAVAGFCLGGTLAWLAAARSSADACVSYYGTRLPQYIGDATRLAHPLLMHMGEADHFTPPEVIAQVEQATAGNPLVERHRYPGCRHAFCNPAQSGYNAEAAVLAHGRSVAFLRQHLVTAGH